MSRGRCGLALWSPSCARRRRHGQPSRSCIDRAEISSRRPDARPIAGTGHCLDQRRQVGGPVAGLGVDADRGATAHPGGLRPRGDGVHLPGPDYVGQRVRVGIHRDHAARLERRPGGTTQWPVRAIRRGELCGIVRGGSSARALLPCSAAAGRGGPHEQRFRGHGLQDGAVLAAATGSAVSSPCDCRNWPGDRPRRRHDRFRTPRASILDASDRGVAQLRSVHRSGPGASAPSLRVAPSAIPDARHDLQRAYSCRPALMVLVFQRRLSHRRPDPGSGRPWPV